VWERFNGNNYIVQAAVRPRGGGWQQARDVSAPGQSALQPQVAADADGTVIAVWRRLDGTHGIVQAAVRPAGGTWTPATDLSAPGGEAQAPQLAVNAAGAATVVWERYDGTDWIVQAAARPAGGTWTPATDLSAPGRDAEEPQLAVDAAGNGTAVWYRSDGSNTIVQARGLDAAGPVLTAFGVPARGRAGRALTYTADGYDVWSAVTGIHWAFGDGSVGIGPSISHRYDAPGTYRVSVTLTDAVGNTSTRTGITVIARKPKVTKLRFKPAKISARGLTPGVTRRTRAVLALTAAGKVRLTFKRAGAGKRVATLVRHLPAGTSRIGLTAKIGKVRLEPGRYVVKVVAKNAAGRSPAREARLTVVR
jgi:hypothetical protein